VNATEDRLRAIARHLSETIPDGSAPPLRLPERAPHRRWRGGRGWLRRRRRPDGGQRNWGGWAAPVAATLAVTGMLPPAPRTAPGSAPSLATVPPYYVQTAYVTKHAAIKSTLTGHLLAVVTAPGPYVFTLVTAAADDRTFVFGAEATARALNWHQSGPGPRVTASTEITRFFVLRFDPGQHGQRLEPLRVPLQNELVTGAAVSPDARELAVASWASSQLEIQVFTLATGAVRTWHGTPWSEPNDDQAMTETSTPLTNWMSWSADDRTLAVDWPGPAGYSIHPPGWPEWPQQWASIESVSEISAAGPTGNLATGSTDPLPAGAIVYSPGNAVLTPDGKVLVDSDWTGMSGLNSSTAPVIEYSTPLTEYSARTGVAMGRFGQTPASTRAAKNASQVLWTNATGSVLIVAEPGQQNLATGTAPGTAGVLTRTGFTPLRGFTASPGTPDFDDATVAW
jgi:hypothetical protein